VVQACSDSCCHIPHVRIPVPVKLFQFSRKGAKPAKEEQYNDMISWNDENIPSLRALRPGESQYLKIGIRAEAVVAMIAIS